MKFVCLVVAIISASVFANAQQAQPLTELAGTAIDQAGAIIPSVRILLSSAKGKKYEVTTTDDGSFQLKVPAGTYLVEAEYTRNKAWEPFRIEKYEVATTKRMTLDICLRVSQRFTDTHGTPVTTEERSANRKHRASP